MAGLDADEFDDLALTLLPRAAIEVPVLQLALPHSLILGSDIDFPGFLGLLGLLLLLGLLDCVGTLLEEDDLGLVEEKLHLFQDNAFDIFAFDDVDLFNVVGQNVLFVFLLMLFTHSVFDAGLSLQVRVISKAVHIVAALYKILLVGSMDLNRLCFLVVVDEVCLVSVDQLIPALFLALLDLQLAVGF